jgi:hypothetical protein
MRALRSKFHTMRLSTNTHCLLESMTKSKSFVLAKYFSQNIIACIFSLFPVSVAWSSCGARNVGMIHLTTIQTIWHHPSFSQVLKFHPRWHNQCKTNAPSCRFCHKMLFNVFHRDHGARRDEFGRIYHPIGLYLLVSNRLKSQIVPKDSKDKI